MIEFAEELMQMCRRLLRTGVLAAATLSLVVGTVPESAWAQETDGSRVRSREPIPTATLRTYETPPVPLLQLPPLPMTGPATPAATGAPLQVGTVRWLPPPERRRARPTELSWARHSRGRVTAVSVTSPGARSVRLGLRVDDWPRGAELRTFGHGIDRRVHGPLQPRSVGPPKGEDGSRPRDSGSLLWTPLVDGDTVSLELRLPPGITPEALDFEVAAIAHVTVSPFADGLKHLSDIGASAACNQDVRCTGVGAVRDSVAKIIFVSGGGAFLCTGQLIDSVGGPSNLFTTAGHCISSAGEASSVDMFWFFERAACGGPDPTSVIQTSGGRLLHTADADRATDLTLLQLTSPPPAGAFRSGWSTSAPGNGSGVVGVHHPSGDLKMASEGTVTGREAWSSQGFPSHLRVAWSAGVTEGGSSGSGLFSGGRLVGVLTGGASSCSQPDAPDFYGRFDLTYPDMVGWLNPGTLQRLSVGDSVSTSVDDGGWIHYRIAAGSGDVRVEVRPSSGDADLYAHRFTPPGLASYECRSRAGGAATDSCDVRVGGSDAYVGVYGWTGASFELIVSGDDGDGGGGGGGDDDGGVDGDDDDDGGNPLPDMPTLLSPEGPLDHGEPVYRWESEPLATAYEIRVEHRGIGVYYGTLGADELCAEETCALATPPAPSLLDGPHTWAVQAMNDAGRGPWSPEMRFEVDLPPPLGIPEPGTPEGSSDGEPVYGWTAVDGATAYELQVSSATAAVHGAPYPAGAVCTAGRCSVASPPVESLPPGGYSWRVRAVDGRRLGAWSAPRAFHVPAAADRIGRAPRPLRPRGRVVMPTAVYEWIPAADADAYRVRVQGGGEVALERQLPADVCEPGLCSWDPPGDAGLPEGRQRWRVRARVDGDWGAERGNRYDLVRGAPRLITPVGRVDDASPTFQWTPVPGALRYRLQVRGRQGIVLARWIPAASACGSETCRVAELIQSLSTGEYSWSVRPGDPAPTDGRSDLGRFVVE